MKITVDHVVALERAVAAPRGAKRSLAAHTAECRRDVAAFAALQQHYDDQEETRQLRG